ncbi:hypothetical protein CPB83DRAFT_857001 [Crepidotus variabilis]|uniref:Replication protein A subunit n=1 Tax=Crepidotus variabilis TaxID=179855 RepID=A0A9P6ECP9_9AGAR|nr:hypothetical protein CPB83DRAFT_857001 [Crepidotus variabilis]
MSEIPQLTGGICKKLLTAPTDDPDVFESEHTVQFLSVKQVSGGPSTDPSKPSGPERFRIIMSDGVNFMQAMLATQLNSMVFEEKLPKNAIAVVEKITCNIVQGRRLIILLALRVIAQPTEKIGSPTQLEADTAGTIATPTADQTATPSNSFTPQAPQEGTSVQRPQRPGPSNSGRGNIYPIEGLSPYQNNWTIKARVTQKSEVKTWSNPRGEGKLFNVTLMDDSGEIRATAFNATVDDFYAKLEEGKVYYISKARVNLAKKKFSNLNNDYELGLERATQIEECLETTNVPTIKYNFMALDRLQELVKDSVCDVIGIVKDVHDLTQVNSAKMNKQIPKRDMTLVDKSGFSVRMTLWGKQAEQYNEADANPVIAFKGVKVGDYQGGRTLSMVSSSTMQINPDIDECFALRGWYDSSGVDQTFQAHSSTSGGGSTIAFNRSELRGLDEVKQGEYGMPGKPEVFSARGTVMHIKSDNISYPACPNDGCSKKVEELGDKNWRCEKCNQSFEAPRHRYIMSMAVADYSGQAWLQGFNDVGEAIFGKPANDLVTIKNENNNEFMAIMERSCGQTFNFSCRAKQDTWKDNNRIRYGISRITPLNYKEEAAALRDLLFTQWAN